MKLRKPKIVLELNNMPRDGDILIFNEEGYDNTNLEDILMPYAKNIKMLHEQIAELEESIEELRQEIRLLKGEDE